MNITIAERLRPFSHTPGAKCLLPGTHWCVQAFPTRLIFSHPTGRVHTLDLQLQGPVPDFTLLQDLEHGSVRIFGTWKEGFFLWEVGVQEKKSSLVLRLKRAPEGDYKALLNGELHSISKQATFTITAIDQWNGQATPLEKGERLSFGSHKKQEWEKIEKRKDLREILPLVFRLATLTPYPIEHRQIEHREIFEGPSSKDEWPSFFENLFRCHFRNLLLPTLCDEYHQGITTGLKGLSTSTELLRTMSHSLRSLFFAEDESNYTILPNLPHAWDCGRLIHLKTKLGDTLDIEWSKKLIRRAVIRPSATKRVVLQFPKTIKSFRVRTLLSSKGQRVENPATLFLEKDQILYFDRFEK